MSAQARPMTGPTAGLLALVEGLALRLLTAGSSADVASARAALRSAVAHACPGECRRHVS